MFKYSVAIILALSLTACSNINNKSPVLDVSVSVEEPDKTRFSGKGAGAGMMLMSSMGPMGIAIGVAIDEGIGKDIDAVYKQAGLNVSEIVKTAFESEAALTESLAVSELNISIQRYGFVVASGEDVNAQIHVLIKSNQGEEVIKYPEAFKKGEEKLPTADLDALKKESAPIKQLLEQAAVSIAKHYFSE